jgi:hypothetical protein
MKIKNFLFISSGLILLSSCASTSSTYLASEKFPSKTENCSLEVLNTPPKNKEYVEIEKTFGPGLSENIAKFEEKV